MLLNTDKIAQTFRISRSEIGVLAPAFLGILLATTLAQFLASSLLGLMTGVQAGHIDPRHPPFLFGLVNFTVQIAVSIANFIAIYTCVRNRSLGRPLSLGILWQAIMRSFMPVLGAFWAIGWRATLLSVVFTVGILLLLFAVNVPDSVSITAGAICSIAAILYFIPLVFACYFRLFHPDIPYRQAKEMAIRQMRGRQAEYLITMLVLMLLLWVPLFVLALLFLVSHWLIVLALVVFVAAMVPAAVFSYLYYEEFELAEGLHPPHGPSDALPPSTNFVV